MRTLLDSVRAALSSRRFFWVVIVFFVFEAAWIALSAVYPQAFDEDFHFGLIQAYSHYWLPFLSSPPPGSEAYGAMTRDPSFMYHYLMSFPYRLVSGLIHGMAEQIIIMRFINIGLFTAGLLLMRRVLGRAGLSALASNVCLLIFVLIPIVPQVAGQVNYDNLLMPMVAYTCLLVFRIIADMEQRQLPLGTIMGLLAVCFFATLVKYEFAPIFLGIVIFLVLIIMKTFRGKLRETSLQAWQAWRTRRSFLGRAGLVAALLLSVVLFVQRDGVNLVQYHTLAPDCSEVLTIDSCSSYPVWSHDYASHQLVVNHVVDTDPNPLTYVLQWVYWLWYRLFFAVNGPASSFANFPPLPLPVTAFALIVIAAVVAIIRWRATLFRNPVYVFLGIIIVLYLLALLVEGYLKYRATAVLELMNGRYLLPIILPGAILGAQALGLWLKRWPRIRIGLAVVAALLFLQGGGLFTFLSRSDASWDWQNSAVIRVNNTARHIVEPVLIDGPRYYTTTLWFYN